MIRAVINDIRLSGLCLVFMCLLTTPVSFAQNEDCDNDRLERATLRYDTGLFEQVFDELGACVPDGYEDRERRVVAYRLMALSHIAMDSHEEAREWVGRIVSSDSRYRAVPDVDPPRFVGMVDDMRPNWYTWLWKGNEWYKWTGRAALVGASVAVPVLLTRKDPPPPDLPLPPDFPR